MRLCRREGCAKDKNQMFAWVVVQIQIQKHRGLIIEAQRYRIVEIKLTKLIQLIQIIKLSIFAVLSHYNNRLFAVLLHKSCYRKPIQLFSIQRFLIILINYKRIHQDQLYHYLESAMGVKKLLELLKPAISPEHLSSFRNTTLGIDIYIWIHKACYVFAEQMRETGDPHAFLPYIHRLLDLLQFYAITPLCVFDGRSTPRKRTTIAQRSQQKMRSLRKGRELTTLSNEDAQLLAREQELQSQRAHLLNQMQEAQQQIDLTSQSKALSERIAQEELKIEIIDQEGELQQKPIKESIQKPIRQEQPQNINNNYQILAEAVANVETQRQQIARDLTQLKKRVDQGKKCLNRAVFLKQELILATMNALRSRNIEFVVAPFEGETQLAKLYSLDKIKYALSEDSDLVIHQVPTIFKLDLYNGECDFVDFKNMRSKLYDSPELNAFLKMSKYRRAEVAVLLGTDYLPNVKGVGIKRAVQFVEKCGSLQQVVRNMKLNQKIAKQLPKMYAQKLEESLWVLLLGTCYNTDTKVLQFCDKNAVELVNSSKYTNEQLVNLVGPEYAYDQEVKQGLKNARTLLPRLLEPLATTGDVEISVNALTSKEQEFHESKERIAREDQKKGRNGDIRSFLKPRNRPQSQNTAVIESREPEGPEKLLEQALGCP